MVYQKIKEICEKNETSISALEKKVGFGHGTIRKWKTSSPTLEKLKLVADVLDIDIKELIC